MRNRSFINVEIAFALPQKQSLIAIEVNKESTVEDAIERSGILKLYPQIDLDSYKVGIWNKVVKRSAELSDGDRIEIYRPLIADPKEVRKRRAEKAKLEGRADKVTGGKLRK